ncbi:MAG: hypothetical protein JWO60_1814, partial [Frankiales bacterium]|nr:hypothetical protein [Frankiales bacterium]
RDRAAEARDAEAAQAGPGAADLAERHRALSAVDRLAAGVDRDLSAGDRADLLAAGDGRGPAD